MVYILFYAIILLTLILGLDRRISLKTYAKIPLIIMALIIGGRYQTGSDLGNYEIVYKCVVNGINNIYIENFELSYRIICMVVNFLHLNFQAVVYTYAVLSFVFIYYIILNICEDKADIALFVTFFYAFMFSTYFILMRQFLAASIIVYVFSKRYPPYHENRKEYFTSGLLLVLAAFVHKGVFVAILICLLFKLKFFQSDIMKINAIIIAAIVGYGTYSLGILDLVLKYFPQYLYYTEKDNFNTITQFSITVSFMFIIYIAIIILFSRRRSFNEYNSYNAKTISDMAAVTFFMYFITATAGWFHRAYWYTFMITAFLPCWVRRKVKLGNNKSLFLLIMIIFASLYAIYFFASMEKFQTNMFPYRFRLNIFSK